MRYGLSYEGKRIAYDDHRIMTDVSDDEKMCRYLNNTTTASAFGLVTYNPNAALDVDTYDIYFPVTSSLPHVDSIRVAYGNYDTETGAITFQSNLDYNDLVSTEIDDRLPETIVADGVTFYRHMFVVNPDVETPVKVKSGWVAQLFYGCNLKAVGGDYDEWDDVANRIYPLCSSEPGVAYNPNETHYGGIVGMGSTVMYIRQHYTETKYIHNYQEMPTNTDVDRWCTPTKLNPDLGSRVKIFPYIHMNGYHL